MSGYKGTLLRINLTTGAITRETIAEEVRRNYLGGRGLGTYYLFKETDPTLEALSPENKVVIATGPLTATPCPTSGRYMVVTKSPLTGTVASSNSGGFWGAEIKNAGYDVLIIEGRSEKPVYIDVKDDAVEIRDAAEYWNKLVIEVTESLIEASGDPKTRVMMIGIGGQKLSPIAAVMNDVDRAAGRSGVGAVLGSKNLLGITARGTGKTEIADSEGLSTTLKGMRAKIKENAVTGGGLPEHGTSVLVNVINDIGAYPTNNWQDSVFDSASVVSGEAMTDKYLTKRTACYRCPIACGRHCVSDDGVEGGGPEYETLWAYTADCGVDDMNAVIKANKFCNEYGIDTISAGCTIACAMEMYQKGFIGEKEIGDGPPIEFGNADAIVEWTRRMGAGEGFGAELAMGSYRLAEKYGCVELSMTVKKQELPAYDPRGIQGQGLQYATSNRGGCHVRGYLISPEVLGLPEALDRTALDGKAFWARAFQDLTAVIDSLGLCLFTSFALDSNDYAEMLAKVVGWDVDSDELFATGDRIWNIERMYNLQAGVDPSQDTLPKRLLKEPIGSGPSKGMVHQLDQMLGEYYSLRGWTEGGIPTPEKIKDLGISEFSAN